jgi:hypothetical protein
MKEKIVRVPLTPYVTKVDFKDHANKELLTWWYSELIKGRNSTYQPKVLVCFRVVGPDNVLTSDFVHKAIALTELGQFRIGTIWKNQTCVEQIKLETHVFQLNFDFKEWVYRQTGVNTGANPLIPADIYELHDVYRHSQAWLLQFPFSNDPVGLLVPCLEFFSRCYGRSQHVKRVLATYPWDVAKDELLLPLVVPPKPNSWSVNMQRRTVQGDVVLLAHLQYDAYARKQAAQIWNDLEAAQGSFGNDRVFAQAGPWFQGPARMKVSGLWIEEGKRFLGLQVVGCSDPDGVPIYRDRENTTKTGILPGDIREDAPWNGVPPRHLTSKNEIVNVTSADAPDLGSESIEIQEHIFESLGTPRLVIDVERPTTNSSPPRLPGKDDTSDRYSGDENSGHGKGVGHASFHAETVMESQGVLRDVWNMLNWLQHQHPDLIQRVEYLTSDFSFAAGTDPKLLAFVPFTDEERAQEKPRDPNWPYLDTKAQIPRGALVVRITTPKGHGYFFEIQRRPRTIKKEGEAKQLGEENFRGLVFELRDASKLKDWVQTLLREARYEKGVLIKLTSTCPGRAIPFNHSPATKEEYPQAAAVTRCPDPSGYRHV